MKISLSLRLARSSYINRSQKSQNKRLPRQSTLSRLRNICQHFQSAEGRPPSGRLRIRNKARGSLHPGPSLASPNQVNDAHSWTLTWFVMDACTNYLEPTTRICLTGQETCSPTPTLTFARSLANLNRGIMDDNMFTGTAMYVLATTASSFLMVRGVISYTGRSKLLLKRSEQTYPE